MVEAKPSSRTAKPANPAASKAASPGIKAGEEAAVRAKIAAMPEPWRAMGERLHAVIVRTAPSLEPKTWYGMPGYARDGKTVCFFRADKKWMTFGFTQEADLAPDPNAGHLLIECAWFFTALDEATEARLSNLVRQAAR
jgi:hypothetical protein